MHRDLTGLENIHLMASLMRMSRLEGQTKIDSIAGFAGLADFLNEPVRTYSSGMVSRPGFSVAVHADPDILVLDEVLSVGDQALRERRPVRISEFTKSDKTLLFGSHGLKTAASMCTRRLCLERGVVRMDDPVGSTVRSYQESIRTDVDPDFPNRPGGVVRLQDGYSRTV